MTTTVILQEIKHSEPILLSIYIWWWNPCFWEYSKLHRKQYIQLLEVEEVSIHSLVFWALQEALSLWTTQRHSTDQSTLNITGKTLLRSNNVEYCGGSIYALKATVNIVGCRINSKFGKHYGDCSSCSSLFMHNSAQFFGGAMCTLDSTLTFKGWTVLSAIQHRIIGVGLELHSEI